MLDTSTHGSIRSLTAPWRRRSRRQPFHCPTRRCSPASPVCLKLAVGQALAVGPQGPPPGAAAVGVAVILAGHPAVGVEAERVVVVLLPAARGFNKGHLACNRNDTKLDKNRLSDLKHI